MRARAALLVLATLVACHGRPRSSTTSTTTHGKAQIALIDLAGGAPEKETAGLFGVPAGKRRSFDVLLHTLAKVSADKDTAGVFVRFGLGEIGLARSEEVALALENVKAQKPVYCHADAYGNTSIVIASRGCTKVYLSPAGEVDAVGLAAQIFYMRKLLAEELHFDIDMLQVGKFKGAEEPLTRDGPSDEARQSLEAVLVDMRTAWLAAIKKGRGDAAASAVEDGPYSPKAAKAHGIVDDVLYEDEARDELKKAVSAGKETVKFGPSAADESDDLDDLLESLAGGEGTSPVMLVRAVGSISMGGGDGLFGGGGITEKEMSHELARLEKDDAVKAVVLRIDSPGGSALASDLIWHALMRIRAKKPIVVSVGDMAASGGYYLASTGNYIFADATSIVGSIGVVGGKVGVGSALDKIGVHSETFPANVSNPNAKARVAWESPVVPWDDATRARVLETMTGIYDLFLSRVAEGRKIPVETVAASAEGRIFAGEEGKKRRLVDEIGGLSAAIAKARDLAKLPKDAKVGVSTTKPKFLEAFGGDPDARAVAAVAQVALKSTLPSFEPFVSSMTPLLEGEHNVCALPFVLLVH